MFFLAFFLIFISYLVFLLGILNLLAGFWLILVWLILILGIIFWIFFRRTVLAGLQGQSFISILLFGFILLNSLKLLTPETSFDALWYHLTLPKLYLQNGGLKFFKGGLLYYSAMPQLAEMFYVLGLFAKSQILSRSFHFFFGILSLFAIFQLSRKFLSRNLSLFAVLIFYSQLAVCWLSSAAYIDLTRTFFEVLALLSFWNAVIESSKKEKKNSWLFTSGIMIGAAIATKFLSAFSAITLCFLILIYSKKTFKNLKIFLVGVLLTASPWLIYGFLKTKTFLYPFLTSWFWQTQTIGLGVWGFFKSRTPQTLAQSLVRTAFTKGDILSPIYLISLPLFFFAGKSFLQKTKPLLVYLGLNYFFWFLTPINYNRFLLPYTPALIILILSLVGKQKVFIKKIFTSAIFLIAILHLGSRAMILKKDFPFLLRKQSQRDYLAQRLDKETFFDKNNFLKENVSPEEKVLVHGSHNLFYMPVAFDHLSWGEKEVVYKYLVVQAKNLPEKWQNLKLVHQDKERNIKIYEFSREI